MTATIEYDWEANAVYIRLRDVPYAYGADLDHERRVDYGSDRQPIGIELTCVRGGVNLDNLPEAKVVARLLEKHKIPVFA
ncbi:MAG: DUF2283 domain-containing protein [Chloroflexota bacterium]